MKCSLQLYFSLIFAQKMEFSQKAEICLHCVKEQQGKMHQGNKVQAWLDKHWKVHVFQAADAEEPFTEKSTGSLKLIHNPVPKCSQEF